MKGSLSDWITNRTDIKVDYVKWYFVFALELAIRILLLEQIGSRCPETCKTNAINEINDWIIWGCDMDEERKNPKNILKQKLQKQGRGYKIIKFTGR